MSNGDFYLTPNAPDATFGNIMRFLIKISDGDYIFYIQAYENNKWVSKKIVQMV